MALHLGLTKELDELLEATEASLVDPYKGNHYIGICRCRFHDGKRRSLSIRVKPDGNLSVFCKKKCEDFMVYEDLKNFCEQISALELSETFVKCPRVILNCVGKTLGEINPSVSRDLQKVKFSSKDLLVYLAQRSFSDESIKGPSYPLLSTLMRLTALSKSAVSVSRRNLVAVKFIKPEYRVKPPLKDRKHSSDLVTFGSQVEVESYLKLNPGAEQTSTTFDFPEIKKLDGIIMPDSTAKDPFIEPPSTPTMSKKLKLKLKSPIKKRLRLKKGVFHSGVMGALSPKSMPRPHTSNLNKN